MKRTCLRALGIVAFACASSPARATVPGEPEEPVKADQRTPSMWKAEWPEFSIVEAVLTSAAGLGSLILFASGPVTEPRWRGGILFDDAVRGALRAESEADRDTAQLVSDVSYYGAPVIPFVVDTFALSLVSRGDPKVARNLGLVSLEGFAYSGLLSFSATHLSARERPGITECLRGSGADEQSCDLDSRTEAFWSGHTTIAATSAGLVCAHHAYMPLWGDPVADVVACVMATANAATTGIARITADQHYASDVVVGSALGFVIGYGVPTLLHYTAGARPEPAVSVAPFASPAFRGVAIMGAF